MKQNDIIRLVVIILIVAVSVLIAFFPSAIPTTRKYTDKNGVTQDIEEPAFPYRLGLDLRGGVHIVMDAIETKDNPVTDEAIERTIAVLENRVNQLGVSETVIQRQGDLKRIIVDIPGYQDVDQALSLVGKTALLQLKDKNGKVVVTGNELKAANAVFGPADQGASQWHIQFELNPEGAAKFKTATEEAAKNKDPIAIFLDDQKLMEPTVNSAITDGKGIITGGSDDPEAQKEWATTNAILISGGALPIKLDPNPAELKVVGATLGQDTIANVQVAAILALILVGIYMLLNYRGLGMISILSLSIYACIYLMLLLLIGAVFSLPAIGGAIISIGMAVDANVIIFERIRDELRDGKSENAAVANGFAKAFRTVLDSNITTLIGTGVLYVMGTGAVKGFAVTLTFGIIASFFTAVFVTRFIIDILIKFMRPERGSALYTFIYGVGGGK
jgi:preprotein translocase subunit SecD